MVCAPDPGVGCGVSGFGFRVSGFGFRILGSGFRVSVFGFRFSVFGLRVRGLGKRGVGVVCGPDTGFGFQSFRVWGLGCGCPLRGGILECSPVYTRPLWGRMRGGLGITGGALPTETKVESGTSESKSGTSVNLSKSG